MSQQKDSTPKSFGRWDLPLKKGWRQGWWWRIPRHELYKLVFISLIGATVPILVTRLFLVMKLGDHAASPPPLIAVTLNAHLSFDLTNKKWHLVSAFTTQPGSEASQDEEGYRRQRIAQLSSFLKTVGWQVEPFDSNKNLSCTKILEFEENLAWWRFSHYQNVPILPAHPTKDVWLDVANGSELLLDAPKGLVLETFPPIKDTQPLVVPYGDFVRLHIPLSYAFDEPSYLNMKTSTLTVWGGIATTVMWLFGKGLKWLIGTILALIGGGIATRIPALVRKRKATIGYVTKQ